MSVPIETLLGAPQLIGLIQNIKSGIPRTLPDPFFNVTRNVITDFASYRRTNGTRRLPKAAEYGAASRAAPKLDMGETSVKLIHTIENQQFGQVILTFLDGMNTVGSVTIPQLMAEEEIQRQTVAFKVRFQNLRTAAVTSMVANGKIFLAGDGTFLPSATGASYIIDFQVPAGNVGTVQSVLGGNGATYLSWDNPAADIVGAVIALKTKSVQTTGFELKYAFYGANVPGRMLANTSANALIRNTPRYAESYLNAGDIPAGFQGLTWIPVYSSFFEDDNGVVQQFFGPDQVAFCPEITPEWYEMLQGSYVIRPTPGVYGGSTGRQLTQAVMPYGMFSYAVDTNDPIGTKQVMGDTFLPVAKNGSVLYSLTTKY